jgi:VIT1/CCC1 family predicted Fe2+/Mn2+ transporter
MADGLTVPFALAAGLSAAVTSSQIIVTAGLAEVAAGAIVMGLGGYLAARSDQKHYASEERREYQETVKLRDIELGRVLINAGPSGMSALWGEAGRSRQANPAELGRK